MDHPVGLDDEELLRACRETRTRRGGPGGQHRNKVETAVVLLHVPTGVTAEASERRSQSENRRVALHRLRTKLAVECRITREQVPSRRWLDRVKNQQLSISVDHHDYALLVAEAFDHLALCNGEMRIVSKFLRVTPTQLAGIFRKNPMVWIAFNADRIRWGLRPLK